MTDVQEYHVRPKFLHLFGSDGLHHVTVVTGSEDEGFEEEELRRQIREALEEHHTDRISLVQHRQRGVPPKSKGKRFND
ncbi:MAG: hypothetical protein ACOCW6_03385 [Spirochaetota bacterium]